MPFFSFNKDENWFATLTKVAIFKTKLLAGNDHVIDIFTSEDMENISLCIFQYLTVNYIINIYYFKAVLFIYIKLYYLYI